MELDQFSLLKTRRFLPLFITQFVGAFNRNALKNALVFIITYRLTDILTTKTPLVVTLAAAIFILPFFLFSAIAGQLADKYEKTRLITIIKFTEIIIMLLGAIGLYAQSVTLLMTVLFLVGTQAAFFSPLKYAILPDQLPEHELIAGNALIEASIFISILLGMVIGRIFIVTFNGDDFIAGLICCMSIVGFISSLYLPKTPIHNPHLELRYNFILETLKVIEYSKQRWDIYLSIVGISWFWSVGGIFLSEFPVLSKTVLHTNQYVVTFFLSLFSIGIAAGSLLCNRLLKGKVHATYVPIGALGMSIFIIDLFFAANHASYRQFSQLLTPFQLFTYFTGWRISFDILLIAICGGIYTVPLYAILQQRSDPAYRAQVIASNNVMNATFMVVAALAAMVLFKIGFSVSHIFLVVAILNGLVALYICRLLPNTVLKSATKAILKCIYRVKVIGIENYQNAGNRIVIIANHISFLDAVLLAAFLPDKLTFAVSAKTANKWWIRYFLSMIDAYPIDHTNSMALKSLIDFVKQDKKCVIFPEGRLTMTGALMKIYEGPGLVADKADAKLLPIHIQGAQFTPFSRLKGKVPIRWAPQITLTIFPPESIHTEHDLKGHERRQKISLKLYQIMTNMMFESADYRQSLFSSLIDAKEAHGRHYPIIEDTQFTPNTYQQLITRSFILGSKLSTMTSPGEHIGVLLPNMVATVITFFGLHAYCRVPAMLNFTAGVKNIINACKTALVKTVCTSHSFIELADLQYIIDALTENGITIIYLEDIRAEVGAIDKIKGAFYAQFPHLAYRFINRSAQARKFMHADAPAVILFTSGSEGTPKGVVLSHKNIQANRHQLSACIDFTRTDKVFNVLPLFHSFGLTGGLFLPVLSGVYVFLYPSPLHYRIVPELVYDKNATILFGTDTFLTNYAKYAHPYDFYSVRYIFSGAEKLRAETQAIWANKFGVRIFDGYGATEASPVIATNLPMQNRPGTVGKLLPGIQYKIKPVPGINEGGVLVVSGPNIMKGYLLSDQPGQLVPPENGWYETGDIVSMDNEGYVTIKGRVKRFAKIAGEMVSLTQVEQQVSQLWPLYQHAVISVPDERKGEQIVLVTTNQHANREQLVAFAKLNQMADISIPRSIIVLEEIPLLGSGKTDYTTLKEQLAIESVA